MPGDDVVLAKIMPVGGERSYDVRLLNISEGGIGLQCKRSIGTWIKVYVPLQLMAIVGHPHLANIADLSMEVRWVMDEEYLDHMVIGCKFTNLDDHDRRQLKDFVMVALAEQK